MRKKILIFGHYGVPNWGDEAILSGILSQINCSRFSVTVVSNDLSFTKKHHRVKAVYPPAFGIRSFFRGGFFAFLNALNTADYIIIGGGGLFQENPPKALSIWKYYLSWCVWKKKKIFVLGNSFEKISNIKILESLQKKFKKVKIFSVRDEASKKILETQYLVPSVKISITTDAAYFLPYKAKPGRKKGILLSFREGEMTENREKKILKILKENFSKEFMKNQVEVVVMQEKNAGDSAFAHRHELPIFTPSSLSDLQDKIRSTRFVLTTRLHAGILSSLCGTPFLALSPRKKISHFFGDKFSIPLSKIFTKKGEHLFQEKLKNFMKTKPAQKSFVIQEQQKVINFFPNFFV